MKLRLAITALALAALTANAGTQQDLLRRAWAVRGGAASATPTTDGLISYWPFTGNANDAYGTNNGTVVNATLTNGVKGAANTAYWFNGTSAAITISNKTPFQFTIRSNYTITAWGYPVTNTSFNTIFATRKPTAQYQGYMLVGNNVRAVQHYIAETWSSKILYSASPDSTIVASAWHHYAVTYDGGGNTNSINVYVDGSLNTSVRVSTLSSTNATVIDATSITEMGRSAGQYDYWKGALDEIRVYGRVLSAAEILTIYNYEKP